jgi:hypothetical protein
MRSQFKQQWTQLWRARPPQNDLLAETAETSEQRAEEAVDRFRAEYQAGRPGSPLSKDRGQKQTLEQQRGR